MEKERPSPTKSATLYNVALLVGDGLSVSIKYYYKKLNLQGFII